MIRYVRVTMVGISFSIDNTQCARFVQNSFFLTRIKMFDNLHEYNYIFWGNKELVLFYIWIILPNFVFQRKRSWVFWIYLCSFHKHAKTSQMTSFIFVSLKDQILVLFWKKCPGFHHIFVGYISLVLWYLRWFLPFFINYRVLEIFSRILWMI